VHAWVSSHVHAAQSGQWLRPLAKLGWLGLGQMAGLDPTQKTLESKSGSGLGLSLSRPKLLLLRMCLAKHTLMPCLCILSPSILILV
jgi:hypothetical protein